MKHAKGIESNISERDMQMSNAEKELDTETKEGQKYKEEQLYYLMKKGELLKELD